MICVALADISLQDCLTVLKEVEMAELRFDLMNIDEDGIKKIFSSHSNLIATCRLSSVYDDKKRIILLEKAIKYGAAFVDIEVDASDIFKKNIIELTKHTNVKKIVSYHNYEKTPSRDELVHIIDWCLKYNPDIIKISCMSTDFNDNSRLLGLLDTPPVPLIVVGMGSVGKLTRVIAPLLGSYCTFASYSDDTKTAEGQYTYKELKQIYERLNVG